MCLIDNAWSSQDLGVDHMSYFDGDGGEKGAIRLVLRVRPCLCIMDYNSILLI